MSLHHDTLPGSSIRPIELLLVLAHHKWLLIAIPLLCGALGFGATLLMPPTFTSTAKIMPPAQQQSGLAAMLGQVGGLAAAGGLGQVRNPGDMYVGMLESRTVADALITRFKLKARYDVDTMVDARTKLTLVSAMSNGKKDGLLSISASDRDPQVAADMANAYVDELLKLTQSLAISEAAQRRLFFEKQLRDTNANLANAEIAMRSTQEKTGMIQPEKQVQAIITALAQHKGAIAAKEVQLNAMRTFAAPGNPELRRVEEELRTMKGQLSRLEVNRVAGDGEFMVPSGRIPEVEVEYVRRLRDVKFHEAMFQLLAKQFEMAKIDEAKEAPIFQVLEKAVPAERKSKPRNGFIAVLCAVLGLVLAILFVLTRDLYRRWRADPDNATRWDGLMAALRPARQPKTPGRVPS